jgi:hypothetical protein
MMMTTIILTPLLMFSLIDPELIRAVDCQILCRCLHCRCLHWILTKKMPAMSILRQFSVDLEQMSAVDYQILYRCLHWIAMMTMTAILIPFMSSLDLDFLQLVIIDLLDHLLFMRTLMQHRLTTKSLRSPSQAQWQPSLLTPSHPHR